MSRYYIVRAEVRDETTFGTTIIGVIAQSRDEAISRARKHTRETSRFGRRIVRILSARLSVNCNQKEAHA